MWHLFSSTFVENRSTERERGGLVDVFFFLFPLPLLPPPPPPSPPPRGKEKKEGCGAREDKNKEKKPPLGVWLLMVDRS